MKKIYLFFIIIACAGKSQSQTLNSNHFPSPGDVYKYFYTDTLGIVAGPGGTSQIWNFEDLNVDTVLQTDEYQAPIVTTPPVTGHTTVLGDINQGYSFFKNTPNDYAMIGFSDSANVTIVSYTDNMTLLSFPFSYGNTFTDNYAFTTSFQGSPLEVTGTVNSTIDGTGNLLLPQGAFNNVIRIKYTVVSNATILGFSLSQTQTYYEWYDTNKKFPLLHIENTITSDPFGGAPTSDKIVWVEATGPAGIESLTSKTDFNLTPNPAHEQVNVKINTLSAAPTKIIITNTVGQMVYENNNVDAKLSNLNISTAAFEKGVYFVSVIQNNQTFTKKLMVQ